MYHTRLIATCSSEYKDILTAELAEAGFDTFMETDEGIEAYTEEDKFDALAVEAIKAKYSLITPVSFAFDRIEKQNWNEQWESSYEPINVEDQCLIRAYFHQPERPFPYEIIITPKMSFGTGHHQTTYLMIKNQLAIDHNNKRVMDAGCGTAILSIMASKLGAKEVDAFDIDEWSVINGEENIQVNNCRNIHLQQGKVTTVNLSGKYDIILANINKNVLLDEMKIYARYLQNNGLLLLSGFYTHDIDDLLKEASKHQLAEVKRDDRETWASLLLQLTLKS